MRIHREGHGILLKLLIIIIIANILLVILIPAGGTFAIAFLFFTVVLYLFTLWFFRVPNRSFDLEDNFVFAPADGKVVAVEEIREDEYFSDRRIQVSIFMSPLNVHANYYPVGGPVRYFKYHPGNYVVAWHPKASSHNERTSVVVGKDEQTEVLVRQIAGAVARRIVCYAKTGDMVQQGQEMGFIKFGSRVDILMPAGVKVAVKPGDKVTARISVIAAFN